MRLPVINLPVVYHLGTLNKDDRGSQFKTSMEGAGLSVSMCPAAWRQIARLGGQPCHEMVRRDALYLDVYGLENDVLSNIQLWASDEGLLEHRVMWKSWQWDDESEEWRYTLSNTQEEALAEIEIGSDLARDSWESDDEYIERLSEETGVPEGVGAVVENTGVWVLTEAGRERAQGYGGSVDATDIAVMFWSEDVLRNVMPEVVGIWWDERYDPGLLSAPRGAIFADRVPEFEARPIEMRQVPDDDDLIEAMPDTRMVSPEDLKSDYRYVTCCVDSTAELIDAMIECPADEELSYEDFILELGNGDPEEGSRIIHEAFPQYEGMEQTIDDDYHVRFRRSVFEGMPCLYVVHSAIEYIFQRDGLIPDGAKSMDVDYESSHDSRFAETPR